METNGHLSADDILSSNDLRVIDMDVPEWGGKVWLRTMSGQERDALEELMSRRSDGKPGPNMQNFRARLVCRVLSDADGKRLFQDTDAPKLGTKSGAALARVFNKACEHNHMLQSDVEDLVGNSDSDQTE